MLFPAPSTLVPVALAVIDHRYPTILAEGTFKFPDRVRDQGFGRVESLPDIFKDLCM